MKIKEMINYLDYCKDNKEEFILITSKEYYRLIRKAKFLDSIYKQCKNFGKELYNENHSKSR